MGDGVVVGGGQMAEEPTPPSPQHISRPSTNPSRYSWIGRRCQFTRRPPRAATWSDDGVVWLYWHVSLTGGARSLTDWAGEVVGVHTGGKRLRGVQGVQA